MIFNTVKTDMTHNTLELCFQLTKVPKLETIFFWKYGPYLAKMNEIENFNGAISKIGLQKTK